MVANSSFVADKLMQMFPNKKIMLLEKCVDMVVAHARSRIADRRSLVVKLDPINIIFAKNDWRVGGLEGILKTLGSFKKKNFFFTIAGISSNDMKQVNKLAREYLSDNLFEVSGIMDRASLMDCYIENDVFLSNCDIEAFGLGAIEATSLGCLVISPNFSNGLVENMKKHDFGKILESLHDLEDYLKSGSYIDDKGKNIELSSEIYEAFSPQRMEQQLLKLIGLDQ